MRHCPFDHDAPPHNSTIVGDRDVKIAARHLSQSWPWDEKLEGYSHSKSSPIRIVTRLNGAPTLK
jgi:hypothetical protein